MNPQLIASFTRFDIDRNITELTIYYYSSHCSCICYIFMANKKYM